MRVIIAGGRDYEPSDYERELVKVMLDDLGATEVVSGGARGVDKWGEGLGKELGLHVEVIAADWNTDEHQAGPIRNRKMANYAGACILLTGGRGTANMYKQAQSLKLKIIDLRDGRQTTFRVGLI